MTDHDADIIAAFVDGERVEPVRLKAALADSDARDYFVDLLSLHDAARHLDVVTPASMQTSARPVWKALRLVAAAATLTVAVGAGYLAGHRTVLAERTDRTTVLTETLIDVSTPAPLPPATRVIKLRDGVNWLDHAKGQ